MRSLFLAVLLFPCVSVATDWAPLPEPGAQNQTQNQAQSASSSQSQNNAGNSLKVTEHGQLQIPYTPPPTAPAIYASNPCALGSSKALTLPVFGTSSGKTTVDENCAFLELVRVTNSVDPCLARKLLATHPAIAAIDPNPVTCAPPAQSVTVEDLATVEKRVTDKIGTAFKVSQQK